MTLCFDTRTKWLALSNHPFDLGDQPRWCDGCDASFQAKAIRRFTHGDFCAKCVRSRKQAREDAKMYREALAKIETERGWVPTGLE